MVVSGILAVLWAWLTQAFWNSNGAEKNRCSMAAYEFVEGRVRNVWNFPAYECP